MPKRTKIVATLGPATDKTEVLESIFRAGVDVVRLNFSYGDADEHRRRVEQVHQAADAVGKDIGILADLQGPKIRIERFRNGPVTLIEGNRFTVDADLDPDAGTDKTVGIAYKALPDDVAPGDLLLLNDGQITLRVETIEGPRIVCRIEIGGELSNHKGINRQGGGLTAPALTDKDHRDIVTAAELDVDYLAVSFPRDAEDIELARQLVREAGADPGIVAKIERAEAIENLDEIIQASDAVMIARGDLAVEIGDAELPGMQKRILRQARKFNRVAITATQMMESMINNPVPTRAEILDVANAVMDGTDAVMLSAESAAGKYPIKTVATMARVCEGAEHQVSTQRRGQLLDRHFEYRDETIAMAAMYTASHLDVKAIIALTESGKTAQWMSRVRSGIPIYAMTRHPKTRCRVTLYRGVYPIPFDVMHANPEHVLRAAAKVLRERGDVADGDLVICTKGDLTGVAGGTNSMKILRIGE
jgi:pyruvate kinase